jgi:hypothetical protein
MEEENNFKGTLEKRETVLKPYRQRVAERNTDSGKEGVKE